MFIVFRKRSVLFVLCLVLLALIGLSILRFTSSPAITTMAAVDNWGLSFQKTGKTPIGNASADYLKKFNAFYAGNEDEKKIYLTFDAGYENGYTPSILDTLKNHNIHVAFFIVGNYIETCPDLVKRMVDEGHIVGNHTYHHPNMSKISDLDAFKKEIVSLENLYQETTGQDMQKYYRPPQGKFSESNLKNAQDLGYKTIFWSLAYVDWYVDKQPSHQQAFDKLMSRIHPGAVVLLHSTSQTNAEILDELLTKWEAEGYTFGTLDELCANTQ